MSGSRKLKRVRILSRERLETERLEPTGFRLICSPAGDEVVCVSPFRDTAAGPLASVVLGALLIASVSIGNAGLE